MSLLGLFGALFLLAQPAHAFYDPSLSRWINCNPIEETGFQARTGLHAQTFPVINSVSSGSTFGFVENSPMTKIDPLGIFATFNE